MILSIDEKDSRPIYQQLVSQVREQVGMGVLQPGDELPSVRDLSESLGINMHTVRRAYLKLRDQDVIILRLGRRARVSSLQTSTPPEEAEVNLKARLKELLTDAVLMGYSTDDFAEMVDQQLRYPGTIVNGSTDCNRNAVRNR